MTQIRSKIWTAILCAFVFGLGYFSRIVQESKEESRRGRIDAEVLGDIQDRLDAEARLNGHYPESIELFRSSIEATPEQAEVLRNLVYLRTTDGYFLVSQTRPTASIRTTNASH